MKNLSKVIAITAVAAMSFSCLSAYAAEMPGKSGQMSFQPAMAKVEMKMGAGINNEASNKAIPNNGKINTDALGNNMNNKNMPNNIGNGMNDKGMKGEKPEMVEMTEEEKAAKIEELKADLAAKLEAGEITQEEYDEAVAAIDTGDFMFGGKCGRGMKGEKPEKVEMTEEEKAAKIEELKADLAAKLEAGEITQEEYDETIAAIEAGEFMPNGKGGRDIKGEKPEKVEMTEEEKAAKIEELKADLTAKLEAGEITQEEYDKAIVAIEAGEFIPGGKAGRDMKGGRHKAPGMDNETDTVEDAIVVE